MQNYDEADPALVDKAIDLLNERGYMLDEECTFPGSGAYKGTSLEFMQFLEKHGYTGGMLQSIAKMCPNRGPIYALYDMCRHNIRSITTAIEDFDRINPICIGEEANLSPCVP